MKHNIITNFTNTDLLFSNTGFSLFVFLARQPSMDQGRLILEVSRSRTTTRHNVGLIWTNDQLVAKTST